MRGRKPTPTALHLIRGNPGKRKRDARAREPRPARLDILTSPAWLHDDAKAEWDRLAPVLARLGVLTETDTDALTAYCEAWVTWKEATQKIRRFGMVIKGKHEVPMMSPYVKIADHALRQMRALLVEFGMTPSARARIRVPEGARAPVSKWGGQL